MKKSQPDSEVAGQTAEASKLTAIDVTSIFDAITAPVPSTQTTAPATTGSSSPGAGNLSSMLEKVRALNNAQPSPQPARTTGASQPEPKTPQPTQKYQMPESGQTTSATPASQMPAGEAPAESITRLLDPKALQSLNIQATKVEATPVSPIHDLQPQQRAEGEVAVTQLFRAPQQPAESPTRASSAPPGLSGAVSPDRGVDSPAPAERPEAALLPQTATVTPANSVSSDSIPAFQTPDGAGVQESGRAPGDGSVTQLLQNLWTPSGQPSSAPARVSGSKYEAPHAAPIEKVEERPSPPAVASKPAYSNTFASPVAEPGPPRVALAAASSASAAPPPGEFTRIVQASAFRESVVAGRAGQASQLTEPEPTPRPAPTPVFAAVTHLSIMMVIVIVLQVVIVLLLLLRH